MGIANCLTVSRILMSVAMALTEAFSPLFNSFYVLGGLTDILDGRIARKTHTESAWGSRLDSIADLLLVTVCLWKILPRLEIPSGLLWWIAGIALLRLGNLLYAWIRWRRWIMLHTVWNKVTGLLLFVLPLSLPWVKICGSTVTIGTVATAAAIQEGIQLLKMDKTDKSTCNLPANRV